MSLFFVSIQTFARDWSADHRMLLFWWLVPLFEPIVLHVISRRVFGESLKFRQVLKTTPALVFGSGVLWFITIFRLSPKRSTLLPIFQLEQGKFGGKWSKRRSVIGAGKPSASFLTFLYAHVELLFCLVFVMLFYWITPEDWIEFEIFIVNKNQFELTPEFYELYLVVYALSVLLIRPLYVVTGFVFYLSRRVRLEAWDIELQFKQLSKRIGPLVLGMIWIGFLGPHLSHADDVETPKKRIEKILNSEEFSKEREIEVMFDFGEEQKEQDDEHFQAPPVALSQIIKFICIAFIVFLIVYLILQYSPRNHKWVVESKLKEVFPEIKTAKVTHLFDENINQQLSELVEELLNKSEYREAMAILYNCSLKKLAYRDKIKIPANATEKEVLRLFRKRGVSKENQRYFENVTRQWIALAYGQRDIPEQTIREFAKAYDAMDLEEVTV